MPTVIITGGTGLIGKRLSRLLIANRYEVIVFSHSKTTKPTTAGFSVKYWNIEKGDIDRDAIAQADYIVHLAGANVAEKRWTAKRKEEILNSRTQSSALLVKALREIPNKVKAVISASAIGWYGEDTHKSRGKGFTEDEPPANDFLGQTCRAWESSIEPVTALNKRLVILRTGIVLSTEGGALAEFIKPAKVGIASILGSGKQVISWLHVEDMCRMYLYAIETETLTGVYNAVSAFPVTNKEMVTRLAKKEKGFYLPVPVPAFGLRLLLGEMSTEVLKSATISSKKIEQSGFVFLYPQLESALDDLLKKK